MKTNLEDLSGHYIICAYGRVGRAVAREFESDGVPFVVVDPDDDLVGRLEADGVAYLIADPIHEATLRKVRVEQAIGLVCAADSDATNVYISMAAKAQNPELFIVARASDRESPDHLHRAGANRVISPHVSSGRHMASLALRPRVVDYLDIADPGQSSIRIEEVRIESGSPFAGITIAEVCTDAIPLMVRHSDGVMHSSPSGSELLDVGDILIMVRRPGGSLPELDDD